jgi:hypothetical protein
MERRDSRLKGTGVSRMARRRARRAKSRTRTKTVAEELFDLMWEAFITFLDDPLPLDGNSLEVVEEDLIDTIASEIYYHFEHELLRELDVYIVDWFARYIVKGTLPRDEEFNHVFFDMVDECMEETDMEEYYACVTTAYNTVRMARQFTLEFLPEHLKVEITD